MPQQGQQGNNIGSMVLPLLAAVGTGAATYYSLRNNQNQGQQIMQQMQGLTNQQSNQQSNQQNQ
jgi:uncharacterized protein HemX